MTAETDMPVMTWIAPDGGVWPLTTLDAGWFTLGGGVVKGLGAVPVTITSDALPRGGTRVRHSQPQPRLLTWPLFIEGPDHATFISRWRGLMRAFTSTLQNGPGTLIVAQPDGTQRQIEAYYQAGWEPTTDGILHDIVVLTLYCPTPWWTAVDETLILRAYSTAGADFQNPYPSVASSQTLGATTVANPGDVEAWPSWRITGPASLIVMTNDATGETWTLDPDAAGISHGDLMLGETITISTDPPIVRGPAGEVWTAALNWPIATLWSLRSGLSAVEFAISGSGVGTSVEGTFHARYESI